MTGTALPDFLREMLGNCPKAGVGVHSWLFRTARHLHAHYPATEIVRMLEQGCHSCGRPVPHREIVSAVQSSMAVAWEPKGNSRCSFGGTTVQPKWPPVTQSRRDAIIKEGPKLAGLRELSETCFDDNKSYTEIYIDWLFPGNPLLCCGKSSREFATKTREEWRGELSGLQLIVPSPMTALKGRKKNPTPGEDPMSAHTLDNTGPRRFQAIEFDPLKWEDLPQSEQAKHGTSVAYYAAKADEQAALLLHLAEYAPLVLALHSGSKSLQGWFYCVGADEAKQHAFMRYAVSLGADTATWTRSQFVRMPDGLRDNGNRQTVHYFAPQLIAKDAQ